MFDLCPCGVYIGLGSNLNNPIQQVIDACEVLNDSVDTRVLKQSDLYYSVPLLSPDNPGEQPMYVNAVVQLETRLSAEALLSQLQEVEKMQGRVAINQRWAPRIIDLDLLLFNDLIHRSENLVLPHPQIKDRDFVLYPLAEIAPHIFIPGLGEIGGLLGRCENRGLTRIFHPRS